VIELSVQKEDFSLAHEYSSLRESCDGVGAICSFVGLVREMEGEQSLDHLFLECYEEMTYKSLQGICEQACERWPLKGVRVIHRYGRLLADDQIVLVLTASAHRTAAYEANEFIMDYLKTNAPFWKKAVFHDHELWVEAKDTDSDRAQRWQEK
jgi:molybdopterin synthase catalytic subunit